MLMFDSSVKQPSDWGVMLKDILVDGVPFDREPYVEPYKSSLCVPIDADKHPTLRAKAGSRTRGIGICLDSGMWRKLTPVEVERLQTVPDEYTSGVSDTQRYTMLGNGWTVAVVKNILKGMLC